MWPHQSGLREILRCVCYEKMEGSRVNFCCLKRSLQVAPLANFQERRGAVALDASPGRSPKLGMGWDGMADWARRGSADAPAAPVAPTPSGEDEGRCAESQLGSQK